jgi:hypothetical protein
MLCNGSNLCSATAAAVSDDLLAGLLQVVQPTVEQFCAVTADHFKVCYKAITAEANAAAVHSSSSQTPHAEHDLRRFHQCQQ